MNYKEFKKYVDKTNKNIAAKLKDNEEELAFYTMLVKRFNDICEEKEKLKKQLEHCFCNRTDCSSRIKDSKKYDSLIQKVENQQQKFINYLEDEIKACKAVSDLLFNSNKEIKVYKEILTKYKEITGVKNDNTK